MIEYIKDREHLDKVLTESAKASSNLWIGTADIKDLHINHHGSFVPYLQILAEKISKGVSVRIIHAKEPGKNFRTDFDKFPELRNNLERMLCPRVHFKLIIIDFKKAYIGSANLTGAAMGSKADNRRNFESGIFTDDPKIVEQAITQFDEVWMGKYCKACARKAYCGDGTIE